MDNQTRGNHRRAVTWHKKRVGCQHETRSHKTENTKLNMTNLTSHSGHDNIILLFSNERTDSVFSATLSNLNNGSYICAFTSEMVPCCVWCRYLPPWLWSNRGRRLLVLRLKVIETSFPSRCHSNHSSRRPQFCGTLQKNWGWRCLWTTLH